MHGGMSNPERRHIRAGGEEQQCPMCGALITKGAPVCRTCGADLTRSGVVLSTVTPRTDRRRARKKIPVTALAVAAGLVALVVLTGISSVGAYVPGLRIIHQAAGAAYHGVTSLPTMIRRLQVVRAPNQTAIPQPTPEPTPVQVAPAETARPASVTILSDPAGAQVSVDATDAGTTPTTLENVATGQHKVALQRSGYQPVVWTITVAKGDSLTFSMTLRPTGRPARKPAPGTAVKPRPAGSRKPLEIGAAAPHFTLKDRIGIIYQLKDWRGQRVAVLLVWTLDTNARTAIKNFDIQSARRSGQYAPVVIALNPDRFAIRQFIAKEQIRLPILFGNQRIADLYGVTPGVSLLYVISDKGIILQRHREVSHFASLGQ